REINTYDIEQLMRTIKNDGELLASIDQIVKDKKKIQTNYRDALTYVARLYMKETHAYKKQVYEKIFTSLAIEEIPEFMIRIGLDESPLPLYHAASFRASLSMRMRQKQLGDFLPEWAVDDKQTAYDFVEQFDI